MVTRGGANTDEPLGDNGGSDEDGEENWGEKWTVVTQTPRAKLMNLSVMLLYSRFLYLCLREFAARALREALAHLEPPGRQEVHLPTRPATERYPHRCAMLL